MSAYISKSRADTAAYGRRIAGTLEAGTIVSLSGPLGSGKTVLVKGIAAALGLAEEDIASPTYTIIQEYDTTPRLHHIDLYRVGSLEELDHLGFEDVLNGDGIFLIEWGEKAAAFLPKSTISITISILEDGSRVIEWKDTGR